MKHPTSNLKRKKKYDLPVVFLLTLSSSVFLYINLIQNAKSVDVGSDTTPTPAITASARRILKYYGVDRGGPLTDANYSTLSQHAVKTIIIDTDIHGGSLLWQNIINLTSKYNFDFVIWPSDHASNGSNFSTCKGWPTAPYIQNQPNDYIVKLKPMLNYFYNLANWPGGSIRLIGIVNAHEPSWSCLMTIDEMTGIRTQLKAYVQSNFGKDIQIWNYIDNITGTESGGLTANNINRIMDVAVTWQHCFGEAEGTCSQARQKILDDRNAINRAGLDGKVDLVYLFQTFAYGSRYQMPTSTEMYAWSCSFLNTEALDGFLFYTWGACWYDSDLWCPQSTHTNQGLWPLMNKIYDSCVVKN